MRRTLKAATAAGVVLIALAAVGCSASATTQAPFVGYKWLVTSITSHGQQTPLPRSERQVNDVYVLFTRNGRFGANDPINFHSASYRLVGDGFTTGEAATTLVGYAGGNQVILLAVDAISAFNGGVHAKATVTGNRLVISVGGFLLNCQRDGATPSSFS
jgi:hypothetical protein